MMEKIIESVKADGTPSQRTGQSFNCKVWLEDVLVGLKEGGIVELKMGICKCLILVFFLGGEVGVEWSSGMGKKKKGKCLMS